MEIKDLIKLRRQELGLTYEELGKLIGVGKSTVRKWETGMIENMRRDNIVSLSKALNISPSVLMGWEEIDEKKEFNKTEDTISIKERKLLNSFNNLNETGKDEAIKRVSELTLIPSYIKEQPASDIKTIAAHNDHLTEHGEMDKIMQDIEDMDNW
ncbi:helix-turn-helix domain-containing protein [Paraclostridium sordellii]|uniref:helix-turn-helix domain-containing protein n=1 Tax=Paraclostridium sordellii TaxID=1505 RepID=UPI000385599E|nr:helix-turn-helix transcriptional regulator [Paeniclostridium sordellii]EPZ57554.1 helix-turn-helix family protein [[Clostridium] sordellii VPI 9048] [Paeniclostridium sordellii VPI 9048]MCR1848618.1 helix-turn-helix domain-containing protein [Paeniclostridium sordellii]MDU6483287.1 helix-turn-helix transcriptional regulator [Paeniclostridium sordellii]CEK39998.1 Transcriptional regulator, HTH-type [[Clostridium] sordellii] [Paeniclostridium sordellii]